MRTIWNGSINFGLVNIPIGLAVAQQRKDTSFRTLHRRCGTPIRQKRWCPFHERDVEADELVKGWEFTKGQFVVVEEEDLEGGRGSEVAVDRHPPLRPGRAGRPDLLRPGLLPLPGERGGAAPPYVLLLRAMQQEQVAAVGKFVLWGKENLCLIRPLGASLALETLYFAEDIRARDEIDEAVGEIEPSKAELDMALQLLQSLVGEFDPEEYENEHRNDLRAMLEAKLEGKEIKAPEPVEKAPVIDLMEALKQSVAQAQGEEKEPAAKKKPAARTRKKAAAEVGGGAASPAGSLVPLRAGQVRPLQVS